MMELEQRCPECRGRGIITVYGREGKTRSEKCGICGAKGRVPTPEGQAILELVEKYGGKPLDTIGY